MEYAERRLAGVRHQPAREAMRTLETMKRWLASCLLGMCLCAPAAAAEPMPFKATSLAAIQAKYAGRPFILSLWSANDCAHCITELTLFGKLLKSRPQLPLVLVATDGVEHATLAHQIQKRHGLARVDSWMFDDPIPERLRQAVDPGWYGDIPRTYLYNARHERETIVGVIREDTLKRWLKANSGNKK